MTKLALVDQSAIKSDQVLWQLGLVWRVFLFISNLTVDDSTVKSIILNVRDDFALYREPSSIWI